MKTLLRAGALAGLLAFGSPASPAAAQKTAANRAAEDGLIVRTHFIGHEQLFADASAGRLKRLWQLPETAALRTQSLNRFATLPALWFRPAIPSNAADQAQLFRPLLDDLLAYESYLEVRATPELFLAIKLPEARYRVWQSSLSQAAFAWKLGATVPVNADGLSGWELRLAKDPKRLRIVRLKDWTLLSSGAETFAAESAAIAAIKANGRPARATGAWLDGDANLARIKSWLTVLQPFSNLPMAHFSFSNRTDQVRMLITLDYPKPHGWKPERWQVPTNFVSDPLAAFLAARGIAPVLEALPWFKETGWKPAPGQVYGWGVIGAPFQFNYAAPARDVNAQIKRIEPALRAMTTNAGRQIVGTTVWRTNQAGLMWSGLPLAVPTLQSMQDSQTEYVHLSLMPPLRRSPAPAELFRALNRDDLVLFDWEITEARMLHWRQFYQLAEIATRRHLTPTNVASQQFVNAAAPLLGETVTEVLATSPTQMTVQRKSYSGLNAFELTTFSRWLESTNFPALGVFRPEAPRPGAPPSNPRRRTN